MGLDHILLYPLSNGVAGLGDLGKIFQDLFVPLSDFRGPVDMGEIIIGSLHIFNNLM